MTRQINEAVALFYFLFSSLRLCVKPLILILAFVSLLFHVAHGATHHDLRRLVFESVLE